VRLQNSLDFLVDDVEAALYLKQVAVDFTTNDRSIVENQRKRKSYISQHFSSSFIEKSSPKSFRKMDEEEKE
jgi:hypothetical protein